MVRDIADRHANGRLALILEGGYHAPALASSVRACVKVLAGSSPQQPDGRCDPRTDGLINLARASQGSAWPF